MKTKINIKEIANETLAKYPDLLFKWFPAGRLHGHEFRCGGLDGQPGESFSVNIRNGKWSDFATGEGGGDPVSLYASLRRIGNYEAAKELAGASEYEQRPAPAAKPRTDRKGSYTDFVQCVPAPAGVPDVKHRLGKPSARWTYRSINGDLIGYVCRFDKPEGGKEVLPLSYGTQGEKTGWFWKSFNEPRPLYNLPAISDPSRDVLIVEGEKCADHAARLFPKFAVMSWPGGGKAVRKVDWSPVTGRRVIIWPDADKPGFETAAEIATLLQNCKIKYVRPPEGMPDGWDVADSDLTPETALAWLKLHIANELIEKQFHEEPPPAEYPDGELSRDYGPEPVSRSYQPGRFADAPFRCLGYDREHYYFFNYEKQQITPLSTSAMTKNNLLALAPKFYWLADYRKGKTQDIDLDQIVNDLLRECHRSGIFDPDRVRGRGAWWDSDGVVVHLGNRVIFKGQPLAPAEVKSDYIYELGRPLAMDETPALHTREANRFISVVEMLAWSNPMHAKLAAGWCVVSHIGGVLHWRPHIWVIGARGSGKTYVMSNVLRPILGKNCVFVQSISTEAGIRQKLMRDSLPVLFDEAEGETVDSQANLQRVLGLIRQSSSDTGGEIAKGTPSGRAQSFMIRSCFALSSINASLMQASDKSRVSILELSPEHRQFGFDEIKIAVADIMRPEYRAGFYARAVKLAHIIRENAVTFSEAATVVLGEQRAGDQIGTLLAGAYSLYSDRLISYDDAVAWIEKQDWTQQQEEIKGESDELMLWSHLMQSRIRVKLDGGRGDEELPLGTLLDISRGLETHTSLDSESAKRHLLRVGIKVEKYQINFDGINYFHGGVFISNTSPVLKKILFYTPWAINWGRILKRLPDAKSAGVIYFGNSGSESRAVFIPFTPTVVRM